MSLIDFILNAAGLLLWSSWRSARADPITRQLPVTLTGTLRRAEPARAFHWHLLAGLVALLGLRALGYYSIGPAVGWTPRVNLYFVTLAFRGDILSHQFLFSVLSFLRVWLIFHFWLLFLAMTSRRVAEPDPIQRWVLQQLGAMGRWSRVVQIILPVVLIAVLWTLLHPLLAYCGVINPAQSPVHVAEQGLLIGAGIYFSLKYLIPVFLAAYFLTSYVYLGDSPIWEFVSNRTRGMLAPLRALPLRLGKIDLAPMVGIAIVLLVLHLLPNAAQNQWDMTLWPP